MVNRHVWNFVQIPDAICANTARHDFEARQYQSFNKYRDFIGGAFLLFAFWSPICHMRASGSREASHANDITA
jgi:hypothetical protein